MPIIGPVYQPTTYNVTYEQQTEWPHQPRRNKLFRIFDFRGNKECTSILFIVFHVFAIIFGVVLVYYVFNAIKNNENDTFIDIAWVMICILYITLYIAIATAWYVMDIKRNFTWPNFIRKQGLARQMNGQSRNGQNMVLNPSTDLLVTSAQYGPVEAPPAMHEEDETHNLMGNDNKEVNDEVEERPLETDPRIVLRPPGREEV